MKKSIIGGILALSMVLPFAASAATLDSTAVFNGQEQVWGSAGQNKTATLRITANSGEVVHAIRTKVGNQASVCKPIAPFEGLQTKDVNVSIVLPPNADTAYNFQADVFTTATLPEAQALTGDLACTGSYITVYNQNSVNVNPSSSSSSTDTAVQPDWMVAFSSLQAQIAALIAKLGAAQTPSKPAGCSAVVAYNGSNAYAAQGSLFAVDAGRAVFNASHVYAPTGYFGPISASAAAAVSAACN